MKAQTATGETLRILHRDLPNVNRLRENTRNLEIAPGGRQVASSSTDGNGFMLSYMPVDVDKRRFTADEYQRMGEAGIFSEKDRVELIDGEVLTMSPIGPPHCAAVDRATRAFILATG